MMDGQVQNMPLAEEEKPAVTYQSVVKWKILFKALEERVLHKRTT